MSILLLVTTYLTIRFLAIYRRRHNIDSSKAKSYESESLRVLKKSGLSQIGQPLKLFPYYIYVSRQQNDFADKRQLLGLPVMGERYCPEFTNIWLGEGIYFIEIPSMEWTKDSKNYSHLQNLIGKVGTGRVGGIVYDDREDDTATRLLDVNASALVDLLTLSERETGRKLPLYLLIDDDGALPSIMELDDEAGSILNKLPFGTLSGTDLGSVENAFTRMSKRVESLKINSIKNFGSKAIPVLALWRKFQTRITYTQSRWNSKLQSHEISIRGVFVRSTETENRLGKRVNRNIHRVLSRDAGFALGPGISRSTRNGIVVGVLVGLLSLVFMTSVFVEQKASLESLAQDFNSLGELQGNIVEDLAILDGIAAPVERLGLENGLDIFGVGAHLVSAAKQRFVQMYRKAVISPFLDMVAMKLSRESDNSQIGELFETLLFLRDVLSGSTVNTTHSTTMYSRLVAHEFVLVPDGITSQLEKNSRRYVEWAEGKETLAADLQMTSERIALMLRNENSDKSWFVDWARARFQTNNIDIGNYLELGKHEQATLVSGAFTDEAYASIVNMFNGISSLKDIDTQVEAVRAYYLREYQQAWHSALRSFPRYLENVEKARASDYIRVVSTQTSALNRFVQTANTHLLVLEPHRDLFNEQGLWMDTVKRYARLLEPQYRDQLQAKGLVGGIADKGTVAVSSVTGLFRDNQFSKSSDYEKDKDLYPLLKEREDILKELAALTQEEERVAYNLLSESYLESENKSSIKQPKALLNRLDWIESKINHALYTHVSGEPVLDDLLASESDYVVAFLIGNTQKYIQSLWVSNVLLELGNVGGWEKNRVARGKNGLIWEFTNNTLAPFLEITRQKKYVERIVRGKALGLSKEFIGLLNRGKLDDSILEGEVDVYISTLPTSVNPEAGELPFLTSLDLACNKGSQSIKNENFPVSKRLRWSASECADVTLRVFIGSMILEKRYPGQWGMIRFLQDFRGGRKSFKRNDFKEYEHYLTAQHIDQIDVRYRFEKNRNIENLFSMSSVSVPEIIVAQQKDTMYVSN
ncbi:MAG: hypothetical protein OEZ43_14855 [Gammaproteobacteria bacterium]|nr:hypothetical protein [Gammaproteobacteria bacterium]